LLERRSADGWDRCIRGLDGVLQLRGQLPGRPRCAHGREPLPSAASPFVSLSYQTNEIGKTINRSYLLCGRLTIPIREDSPVAVCHPRLGNLGRDDTFDE
jgi:hypothetical protein